jgi:hypothetical protein
MGKLLLWSAAIHPAIAAPTTRLAAPPPCGLVFYYHVGKTGGESVALHLKYASNDSIQLARRIPGGTLLFGPLYNSTSPVFPGGTGWFESETAWRSVQDVADKMSGPDSWALGPYWVSVESHVHTPGLAWSFERLARLKAQVEGSGSGCRVLLTTVLREPVSYFWSTYFWQDLTGKRKIPFTELGRMQAHALSRVAGNPNQLCRKLFWSPGDVNCDVLTSMRSPRCTDRVDGLPEVRRRRRRGGQASWRPAASGCWRWDLF